MRQHGNSNGSHIPMNRYHYQTQNRVGYQMKLDSSKHQRIGECQQVGKPILGLVSTPTFNIGTLFYQECFGSANNRSFRIFGFVYFQNGAPSVSFSRATGSPIFSIDRFCQGTTRRERIGSWMLTFHFIHRYYGALPWWGNLTRKGGYRHHHELIGRKDQQQGCKLETKKVLHCGNQCFSLLPVGCLCRCDYLFRFINSGRVRSESKLLPMMIWCFLLWPLVAS